MKVLNLLFRMGGSYLSLVTPISMARVMKLAPVVAAAVRSPEIAFAIVRPDNTSIIMSPRATPRGPPITAFALFESIN